METFEKALFVHTTPFETHIALTENGKLVEYYVERKKDKGFVGNIYKGKVERVLPGLQSAFVDIGLDKNGFLYVADFTEIFKDSEEIFFNGDDLNHEGEVKRDENAVNNKKSEEMETVPKVEVEKEVLVELKSFSNEQPDSENEDINFERLYFSETSNSFSISMTGEEIPFSRKRKGKNNLNFAYKNDYMNISRRMKEGQDIIVQVMKDPISTKSVRLTSYVALPGRYVVYLPTFKRVGVSKKISSKEERKRLRDLVKGYIEGKNIGGFIVRTASEGRSEEEIIEDINFLTRLWSKILKRSREVKSPSLLYEEPGLLERVIRDKVDSSFGEIWVDSEETYAILLEFCEIFMPELIERVKFYAGEEKIFDYFNISNDLKKAFRRKVWLKSGGFIIIDHTEALVSIDVNSGKFIGKGKNFEESVTQTNLEAAREIARQIRLRNLGGIIVIDFIDMADKKNRKSVLNVLTEELKRERTPVKILPFNEFGLVILTRKRVQSSLEKIFSQKCVMCGGNGFIKSIPSMCYEIYESVLKMKNSFSGKNIVIRAHPLVIEALKTEEKDVVEEIEKLLMIDVVLIKDVAMDIDKYSIEDVI